MTPEPREEQRLQRVARADSFRRAILRTRPWRNVDATIVALERAQLPKSGLAGDLGRRLAELPDYWRAEAANDDVAIMLAAGLYHDLEDDLDSRSAKRRRKGPSVARRLMQWGVPPSTAYRLGPGMDDKAAMDYGLRRLGRMLETKRQLDQGSPSRQAARKAAARRYP